MRKCMQASMGQDMLHVFHVYICIYKYWFWTPFRMLCPDGRKDIPCLLEGCVGSKSLCQINKSSTCSWGLIHLRWLRKAAQKSALPRGEQKRRQQKEWKNRFRTSGAPSAPCGYRPSAKINAASQTTDGRVETKIIVEPQPHQTFTPLISG